MANKRIVSFMSKSEEYKLSVAIFVVAFALNIIACISRLLGFAFFLADISFNIQSHVLRDLVNISFKLFEAIFLVKVVTRKKWGATILIAIGVTMLTWIAPPIQWIRGCWDAIIFFSTALIFNSDKKRAVFRTTGLLVSIMTYSLLVAFGRLSFSQIDKFDSVCAIATALDYKLFFVNIFLFDKLRR